MGEAATVLERPERALQPPDLEAIYLSEVSYLWNFLRYFGIAERDLKDVVHEVFLTVHKLLSSFDASRPLRPWLTGIAFRVASDHQRLARHQREIPCEEIWKTDQRPTPEARLEHKREIELVTRALEQLQPEQRAVFVLHDLYEHSMPEIASIIDAPLNTLYSRLRLARAQFSKTVMRLRRGAV